MFDLKIEELELTQGYYAQIRTRCDGALYVGYIWGPGSDDDDYPICELLLGRCDFFMSPYKNYEDIQRPGRPAVLILILYFGCCIHLMTSLRSPSSVKNPEFRGRSDARWPDRSRFVHFYVRSRLKQDAILVFIAPVAIVRCKLF